MVFRVLKDGCRLVISIICFMFLSVFLQSPVVSWLDDDRIGIKHLAPFNNAIVRLCLFLGLFLISLFLICQYGKKIGVDLKEQIQRKLNVNDIKQVYSYYVATMVITLIVTVLIYLKEGSIGELPVFSANPLVFFLRLLTAVVSQPLLEELLFRGILQEKLSRYSKWGALAFSSILFSYSHDYQTILNFHLFSSLMYGIVYMRTKNIKASILLHSLQNIIVIISVILV